MQAIKNQGGKSLVFYLEDESLNKSVISSLLRLPLAFREMHLPEHLSPQPLGLLGLRHLTVVQLQELLQRLPEVQGHQRYLPVRQLQIQGWYLLEAYSLRSLVYQQ